MASLNDIVNSAKNTIGSISGSLSNVFDKLKNGNTYTYAPTTPPKYTLKDRGVTIDDANFNAMRPIIYGEVSNRTPDKQTLEANVIFNTALNRIKAYANNGTPKSLSEIVAMPNQYQAYGSPQYKEYSNPSNVVSLAKKKQVDSIMDEIYNQIKAGTYADNTSGAVFYSHKPNGEIQYNQKPLFTKK